MPTNPSVHRKRRGLYTLKHRITQFNRKRLFFVKFIIELFFLHGLPPPAKMRMPKELILLPLMYQPHATLSLELHFALACEGTEAGKYIFVSSVEILNTTSSSYIVLWKIDRYVLNLWLSKPFQLIRIDNWILCLKSQSGFSN